MITMIEVAHGIYGAWRFAHFDHTGMTYFDQSIEGFWKSFFAAVIVLPAYIVLLALARDSQPEAMTGAPIVRVVFIEAIAYVLAWVAFPLMMTVIADLLDRRERYIGFIVAANWSSVIQVAVLLPAAAIFTASGAAPALLLYVAVWGAILAYAWFIAKTAMDVTGLAAAGLVLLSVIIEMLIDGISSFMIAVR